MAAQPPPFALAPSLVNVNQPIDYSTRYGQSLFDKATEKLTIIFDGKPEHVMPFLQALDNRSRTAGWADIMEMRVGVDAAGDPMHMNLISSFPQITLATISLNALNDYVGQQTRNAQSAVQMYNCLAASITDEVAQKLIPFTEDYTVGGIFDGPCFLKVILDTCLTETAATTRLIRENLMNLSPKMAEYDNNVEDFNNYVLLQLRLLSARGETTHDLMNALLTAYKSVPDKEFGRYIVDRETAFDDGRENMNADGLLQLAFNKYKLLSDQGKWLQMDASDAKLVALTAQLEELKKNNSNLQHCLKRPEFKKAKPDDKKKKVKRDNDDKWKWKSIKPREGAPTTKKVNNKTYHWCIHHQKWTLHKSDECRMHNRQGEERAPNRLTRNMVTELIEEPEPEPAPGFVNDLE